MTRTATGTAGADLRGGQPVSAAPDGTFVPVRATSADLAFKHGLIFACAEMVRSFGLTETARQVLTVWDADLDSYESVMATGADENDVDALRVLWEED